VPFIHCKAPITAEVQTGEHDRCGLLLSVQSAGQRHRVGWIEKNIRARSTTHLVHLFAHHDPLACSEYVFNYRMAGMVK
jgi:hypothetical protein